MKRRALYLSFALLALVVSLFAASFAAAQNDTESSGQPYLGVLLSSSDEGALVEEVVSGGPADEAGVEAGDVITAIDGEAMTAATARDVLGQHAVGDTVTLDVQRGDETLSLDVTLAARPQQPEVNIQIMPGVGMLFGLNVEQSDEGLIIREIAPDSPAAEAGFEVDDVITKVGDTEINQLSDVLQALRNLDTNEPVAVEVVRDGETVTLEISLEDFMMPFGQGRQFNMPFGDRGRQFNMPFDMMGGGARLGVTFITLDETAAEEHGITETEGALILEVTPDSPADAAGLQSDDIVTAVDDDVVDAERTLRDRLFAYEPGDTVTLSVLRDGETLDVEATLDQADFGGMMMPRGFRFFGPDGRRFMHPPIPGMPGQSDQEQPEATAQPNV